MSFPWGEMVGAKTLRSKCYPRLSYFDMTRSPPQPDANRRYVRSLCRNSSMIIWVLTWSENGHYFFVAPRTGKVQFTNFPKNWLNSCGLLGLLVSNIHIWSVTTVCDCCFSPSQNPKICQHFQGFSSAWPDCREVWRGGVFWGGDFVDTPSVIPSCNLTNILVSYQTRSWENYRQKSALGWDMLVHSRIILFKEHIRD